MEGSILACYVIICAIHIIFHVYMILLHFDTLQAEGVAYRGRVLVELSTELDGKVDKNVDDISSDDILVAQVYSLCTARYFDFFFNLYLHGLEF